MSHDGDFMIFEGNRYSRKGFLFKSFAMSAVVGGDDDDDGDGAPRSPAPHLSFSSTGRSQMG